MEWEDMAVIILGSLSSLLAFCISEERFFPYLHFRSSSVASDWFYGHSQRFRSNAELLERDLCMDNMALGSTQPLTEMRADCLENVRASTSHNPMGLHGLLQG
jgi:hypothetical protein